MTRNPMRRVLACALLRADRDSKITTLLSMCGGLAPLTHEALVRDGVYDTFVTRIDTEWTRVFAGKLVGSELGFRLPTAAIPDTSDQDFTACSAAVTA